MRRKARFKIRTILVVTLSSLIIASVLALTVFGFYAYLEWKSKNMERHYRLTLYDLNAQLFNKYIFLNLQAKIDTAGVFKGEPVVAGTIKNISNKTVYSLKLKVALYDAQHQVVYVDEFYPVGVPFEYLATISDIANDTKNYLSEGDSVSFKHQLKNCPPEVLDFLKSKLKFAKKEGPEALKIEYKIEGINIR